MKRIAYIIISNGEDGHGHDRIEQAFWHEHERDTAFHKSKNKLRKADIIVDEPKAKSDAMTKLDGLEKLVLGLVPSGGALRGPSGGGKK